LARLIYSVIASLDGYIEDEHGKFDWAAPDQEVHGFINALERSASTYLYGRRMYEVMSFWGTTEASAPGQSPVVREYTEIWQAADKVVYSRTLTTTSTERTRIESEFDPEAVGQMKERSEGDITVAGPNLAAQAIGAGLVDDLHLFVVPIVVGGGKRALPDDVIWKLDLLDEHRFAGGVVHLHYRTSME